MPVGTDSLTAVFTPTTGAAFSGSTSNPSRTRSTRPPTRASDSGTATQASPGQRRLHPPGLQRRGHHHRLHGDGDRPPTPANGGRQPRARAARSPSSGLTNGDSYTFKVTATNSVGTCLSSAASNAVTPANGPGVPTIGTATAGNAQASVTFTPPRPTAEPTITGYTVTARTPATAGQRGPTGTGHRTSGPITVSGLTNGDSLHLTVKATNHAGTKASPRRRRAR